MVFKIIADFVVSASGLSGAASEALHFWVLDTTKIIFILSLVIFGVGYLRTYFKPERVREYLRGRHSLLGYFGAALLGIVSPFCSCSTIPLFLGFLGAGIPFGMTITFLFVSPMVNEAAVIVLFGVLGSKITVIYVLGGITIGVAGGYILNRLHYDRYIQELNLANSTYLEESITRKERARNALSEVKGILKQVLPYVLVGVGIGALIHGYVPNEVIRDNLKGPLAVPGAVLVGVPVYTNVMGVIPIVESLIQKGLPIGTAIAFMMSVASLSLPQFLILKKVMKKKLILAYTMMISVGIIILGLFLNFILG